VPPSQNRCPALGKALLAEPAGVGAAWESEQQVFKSLHRRTDAAERSYYCALKLPRSAAARAAAGEAEEPEESAPASVPPPRPSSGTPRQFRLPARNWVRRNPRPPGRKSRPPPLNLDAPGGPGAFACQFAVAPAVFAAGVGRRLRLLPQVSNHVVDASDISPTACTRRPFRLCSCPFKWFSCAISNPAGSLRTPSDLGSHKARHSVSTPSSERLCFPPKTRRCAP
jgi:hypothetical protein